MDAADFAAEMSERHLEDAIRNLTPKTVPFSGKCLACGDPVHERRYCDAYCRQDHEKALSRKTR